MTNFTTPSLNVLSKGSSILIEKKNCCRPHLQQDNLTLFGHEIREVPYQFTNKEFFPQFIKHGEILLNGFHLFIWSTTRSTQNSVKKIKHNLLNLQKLAVNLKGLTW